MNTYTNPLTTLSSSQCYWLMFFFVITICITQSYADGLNIDHPLAIGECGYTDDGSEQICRDLTGKYNILHTHDDSTKAAAENKRMTDSTRQQQENRVSYAKEVRPYEKCLWNDIQAHFLPIETLADCFQIGVALCNKLGMQTDSNYTISSVTGRIMMSNSDCANTLDREYKILSYQYSIEIERCMHAEDAGIPCKIHSIE